MKSLTIKVAALLMSLAIPVVSGVWAADTGENTDTLLVQPDKYALVLMELGIMREYDQASFDGNRIITRAELVAMVMRSLGLEEQSYALDETPFADAEQTHWAAGYIWLAAKLGIISGYDQNFFEPDSPAIVEQALKIVISALGRDVYAQTRGGYPMGYMLAAADAGLTKGVAATAGEKLTLCQASRLVYNSLDIPIMEKYYLNGKDYTLMEGKSLLESRLGTEKITAVISATTDTNLLLPQSNLPHSQVEAGGKRYFAGKSEAEEYLGQRVEFYAKELPGFEEKTILFVSPSQELNKIISVFSGDIASISRDKLEYSTGEGVSAVNFVIALSPNLSVIYNGKAVTTTYKPENIKPENGKLTAIDNDLDGIYDVLLVRSYVTYVVHRVNIASGEVFDKLTPNPLKLKEGDIKFSIYRAGVQIGLEGLQEWDVLSIASDREVTHNGRKDVDAQNATLYHITATAAPFMGTVEELHEDKAVIDGVEYHISPGLMSLAGAGVAAAKPLELDDWGFYHVDVLGNIAAVDLFSQLTKHFGYLVEAEEDRSLGDHILCRLFTTGGVMQIFRSTPNLIVDGIRSKGASALELMGANREANINVPSQMIGFYLNKEGQIREIDTAVKTEAERGKTSLELSKSLSQNQYSITNFSFAAGFGISDSCLVFSVPTDRALTEDYFISGSEIFADDRYYDLDVYNIEQNYETELVVRYYNPKTDGTINDGTAIMVVDRVTAVMREDGTTTSRIYGISAGKEVSYNIKDSLVLQTNDTGLPLEPLVPGEIIRAAIYGDTIIRIRSALKPLQTDGSLPQNYTNTNFGTNYRAVFGQVVYRDDTKLVLRVDNSGLAGQEIVEVYRTTVGNYYIFDVNSQRLTSGSASDIRIFREDSDSASEKVFLQLVNNRISQAVIYKYN